MTNKKKYDIIISGYYGYKNSGDDAILLATIKTLLSLKRDLKILVLSKNPIETNKIYNVDSINRFNIFKVIMCMKNAKLFLNGGGSLIQDITSSRSLFFYLSYILLAKALGIKVMLYANGIGPLNRRLNKGITKFIINKVDSITLREQSSLDELKRLKITRPKIHITADPAMTLEKKKDIDVRKILTLENINPDDTFIGFSVRSWINNENFEEVIAKTADYIQNVLGAKALFIAMQPKDLRIINNILSKMESKGLVLKNDYNVFEMLSIIDKMEIIVGMRLHALIYAANLGVPIIGLEYEHKVEGFLKYINQISAGDVCSLDYEKLRNLVDKVWMDRPKIREELNATSLQLKEKAVDNAKIALSLLK